LFLDKRNFWYVVEFAWQVWSNFPFKIRISI
jgi:hypothetical protein